MYNEFIKLPKKEYTHDSEAEKIEAEIEVTQIKLRAIETMEATSTYIINECVNGIIQPVKMIEII